LVVLNPQNMTMTPFFRSQRRAVEELAICNIQRTKSLCFRELRLEILSTK